MRSLRPYLLIVATVIVAVNASFTPHAEADEVQRNVLVLFSNEYELPANQLVSRGFRDELTKSADIRTFTEFLDLVRFPKQADDGSLARHLREKYAGQKFDLIVSISGEASSFVRTERNVIAPGVPVVFAAVSEHESMVQGMENSTGLISHYDILTTLKLAMRLQPTARDIYVITGASDADVYVEKRARDELPALGPEYRLHFLPGLPVATLMQQVGAINRNAIVFYFSMYEDGNGVLFIPRDVARMIAKSSAAPVYGVYDSFMGTGIVGGYMDRFEVVGHEAAKLAIRVLNGENAAMIPPYVAETHRFIVDGSAIESHALAMSALPEDTEIQNWQPPLWRQHFWLFVSIAAAFGVETLLLLWLYLAVRRQHSAERAAIAHQRQMEVQHDELAHLSRVASLGLLSGAIAHELNQPLAAILANAETALDALGRLGKNPNLMRETLLDVVEDTKRAGQVVHNIRSLIKRNEVKKIDVDLNSVVNNTLKLAHSSILNGKVKIKSDLASRLPVVVGDPAQLQQVVLNLVLNACEAMERTPEKGRKLEITTSTANRKVRLVVADTGPGFPMINDGVVFEPFHSTKADGLGIGLSICKSIVTSFGGTIEAFNRKDGGAMLRVEVPVGREVIQ